MKRFSSSRRPSTTKRRSQLGFVQERLLEAGVLDVFLTPVMMKKNRPGTNVTVLVHPHRRDQATAILFPGEHDARRAHPRDRARSSRAPHYRGADALRQSPRPKKGSSEVKS